MAKPLLKCLKRDDQIDPKFSVFCVGYEQSRWRAEELVRDFFRRHLTSFALTYSEWKQINGDNAAAALAHSAKQVYDTNNYMRRGEFGELFLHGILRDFYNAEPAVSKIYFRDTPNDTAKGYDAVHAVINDNNELDLWLGEAKLYENMRSAISEITKSIYQHVENNFLRKEFLAVTNKLDSNWEHYDALKDLLDDNTSLDEIVDRLVVPVLLTYQSTTIGNHREASENYKKELIDEAENAWHIFNEKAPSDFPLTIYFVVLPLENTKTVRDLAHQKLRTYQTL